MRGTFPVDPRNHGNYSRVRLLHLTRDQGHYAPSRCLPVMGLVLRFRVGLMKAFDVEQEVAYESEGREGKPWCLPLRQRSERGDGQSNGNNM